MTTTSSRLAAAGDNDLQDDVRDITDDEVAFFQENGWVTLRNLVSPQLCQSVLERGRPRFSGLMDGSDTKIATHQELIERLSIAGSADGTVTDNDKWLEWRGAVRAARDPVFCRVALAKTMGRNVQRMLGRSKPIRVYHDLFLCKLPDGISIPTGFHQDSPNFRLDRNALTVWIALDEITPDQGSLQFYSGSHRCGMLGRHAPDRRFDLVDEYPELARFSVSPPPHLQAGDCTVHHGLVVHGAGANNSPRPRWSYAICFFPGDARYCGGANQDTDGFDLKIGAVIDHPSFALVGE